MTEVFLTALNLVDPSLALKVIPDQSAGGYMYPHSSTIESSARYRICTNCVAKGKSRSGLEIKRHDQFSAVAVCGILTEAINTGTQGDAMCVKLMS